MTILDILLERKTSLQLATESLWIVITWILLLFIIKTVYKITTLLCDTLQLLCTADFAHLQIFLHPDIAKGPPNPSMIFISLKLCFSCVSGLLTICSSITYTTINLQDNTCIMGKNICYVCNQNHLKHLSPWQFCLPLSLLEQRKNGGKLWSQTFPFDAKTTRRIQPQKAILWRRILFSFSEKRKNTEISHLFRHIFLRRAVNDTAAFFRATEKITFESTGSFSAKYLSD